MSEMQADKLKAIEDQATLRKVNAVALATEFSPPQLLQQAIIRKSDIAVIERLSALAERWEETRFKREAKLAFTNAMVDAKLEMPTIRKNRHVSFESKKPGASDTDYWHEDLAEVVNTAAPILARYGLYFRWRLAQPAEGKLTVACVLEHRGGHSEELEITAGVDLSGNKNHIQAIKSAATYMERITALAACGLAAHNQDDDGRAGGIPQEPTEPVISGEQIKEIERLLLLKGRALRKFLDWCQVSRIEHIPTAFYDDIIDTLTKLPDANP